VIIRAEGANSAGILIRSGVNVIFMVVIARMALLISRTLGWPASMDIGGKISTNDPEFPLKKMF